MSPFAYAILTAAADPDAAAKAVERELAETQARSEMIRQEREQLAAVSERQYLVTELLFGMGGGPRVGLPRLPY